MKNEYKGRDFKIFMDGYKEGCKDTTTELCSCNLTEEDWDSLGEPMTQEELDELREVKEDEFFYNDNDVWYDRGYTEGLVEGRDIGYDVGFDAGYEEAKAYNVILDGEILDAIHDYKNQILSYKKEPWSENHDHNSMIFEIHRGLLELAETWIMNQVWDYWSNREKELGE